MTSQTETTPELKLSALFDQLSQAARFQILLVIKDRPACVCHLSAALGLRQAGISQHLMALREAGWVTTRRESRNIYYSLAEPRLVALIEQAAAIAGVSFEDIDRVSHRPLDNCPCPQCHPDLPPEYCCRSLPPGYSQ